MNQVEEKIASITNLATAVAINTSINEVNGKIPSITNLGAITALTAVQNKVPNVSNLVKKTDCNKYITTQKFNKLTLQNFAARLAQANSANNSDIANFVKKTNFDDKLKNLT